MALKVIGAGWGRTGTESLQKALQILGFGKCYHMFELLKNGKQVVYWEQLIKERKTDYEKLFEGYQSAVDFPVAAFYKELMQQYPEAKVILSYRDAEKWYESASNTILKDLPGHLIPMVKFFGFFIKKLSYVPRVHKSVITDFIMNDFLKGRKNDKAFMVDAYNRWVEEVKRTVPPERLLVFEAHEGWEPLCKFLKVPIPAQPYPQGNDSEQFKQRLKLGKFLSEFGRK